MHVLYVCMLYVLNIFHFYYLSPIENLAFLPGAIAKCRRDAP